jgi:hypothetical protein
MRAQTPWELLAIHDTPKKFGATRAIPKYHLRPPPEMLPTSNKLYSIFAPYTVTLVTHFLVRLLIRAEV